MNTAPVHLKSWTQLRDWAPVPSPSPELALGGEPWARVVADALPLVANLFASMGAIVPSVAMYHLRAGETFVHVLPAIATCGRTVGPKMFRSGVERMVARERAFGIIGIASGTHGEGGDTGPHYAFVYADHARESTRRLVARVGRGVIAKLDPWVEGGPECPRAFPIFDGLIVKDGPRS